MDTAGFIDFLVDADVLTFGDFVTKSGRATPYFLNFGRIRSGAQISQIGDAYAERIIEVFGDEVDVLFGPAYKGIPLAVATAASMQRMTGRDVGFCFNRKEAKSHGEGGMLVGHSPVDGDRVVIVEDVTTAGTSIRETMPLLRAVADVDVRGLIVSVDRQERGPSGDGSALDQIAREFGLTTTAITTIDEVVAHLQTGPDPALSPTDLARIAAYRAEWGA